MLTGPDAKRVVQIGVVQDGLPLVGSGYLVTPTTVLTASHVTAGIELDKIAVQSHLGGWVRGIRERIDAAGDISVLILNEEVASGSVGATYGQLDRSAGEFGATSIGYPRLARKQFNADATQAERPFWDVEQVQGTTRSMTGLRQGTLTVSIKEEPHIMAPAEEGKSLWEGMSGAALWVQGALVGVITSYHMAGASSASSATLMATRLTYSLERTAASSLSIGRAFRKALGISSADELHDVSSDLLRHPMARTIGLELLDRNEFAHLRAILQGIPSVPSLNSIYREAARQLDLRFRGNPNHVLDYVATFRTLVDPLPLFEFITRIKQSISSQDPASTEKLDHWVRDVGPNWGVDPDELDSLEEEIRSTTFVVRIERDMLGEGWQVSAWLYLGAEGRACATTDEQPWDRARLAEFISAEIRESQRTQERWFVELLVNIDMMDQDLEALPLVVDGKEVELGCFCPTVLRSLERLELLGSWDAWNQKWRELHQFGVGDFADMTFWDFDADSSESIYPNRRHTCAGLTCRNHETRATFLRTIIDAGLPAAIWHRTSSTTSPRSALENVLGVAPLDELPETVFRHRQNSRHPRAPQTHTGRDLVLLWDDPQRVPMTILWHEPTVKGEIS